MTYEKEYTPPTVISDDVETNINIQKIWRNIYIWMALGLGAMSGLSYLYIKLPFINSFFINHAFFIFLGSLMIAFLLYMNFTFSSKMSAVSVFSSYTAFILLGSVLLFFIFLYYPSYIAIQTFASISLMFLCMVLPQSIFKHDLSVMSKVILMLISGLFTCFIVNIFTSGTKIDYIVSFLGVFIFAALTAYRTQDIIDLTNDALNPDSGQMEYQVISIFGAMLLYIKFVLMCLIVFVFILMFLNAFLKAAGKKPRRRRYRRRKNFI